MGKRKDRDDSDVSSSSEDSGSTSESEEEKEHVKHSKKEKKDKDKDRKHKKDKKKHKKKHKKKKDKDKGGGKDDEMVAAAKEFLKQQLAGAAAGGGPSAAKPAPPVELLPAQQLPESQRITEDDYFARSNEFMAFLQEYRQILFNELTTEEARRLFVEFVGVWNAGRLATKYYAGLVQAPLKRTSHQWGFKGPGSAGAGAGGVKGMAAFLEDQKDKAGSQREADKHDRRKRAVEQRELLDELLPKATGKDAIAEKRVARREETKARESSPDRAFLPGGGDMMGGDESFAAAKAREAKRAETQRNRSLLNREEVTHKVAQAQAKEDEKMAMFRALLDKGPITIAKRQ